MIKKILHWKVVLIKKRWLPIFLIYFVLQTLILFLVQPQLTPLLYVGRLVIYALLLPILSVGLQHKWLSQKLLSFSIISIGLSIAVLGLLQYFFLPDTRFLIYSGWDEHYYRLISTLFDPNFSALIIGISAIWYFSKQKWQTDDRSFYALTPLFLSALLLTYSRSGYLAFAVGIIFLTLLQKKLQPFLLLIAVALCIPFLPRPGGEGVKLERTASITSRIQSNQKAVEQLQPLGWIVGRGLYRNETVNNNDYVNHANTPDNSFVFLFTSLGGVGSLLLILTAYELRKTIHTDAYPIIIAIAVHSMFNNSLFYPFTLSMLFLVLLTKTTKGERNDKS